jgi:hypothetical protein
VDFGFSHVPLEGWASAVRLMCTVCACGLPQCACPCSRAFDAAPCVAGASGSLTGEVPVITSVGSSKLSCSVLELPVVLLRGASRFRSHTVSRLQQEFDATRERSWRTHVLFRNHAKVTIWTRPHQAPTHYPYRALIVGSRGRAEVSVCFGVVFAHVHRTQLREGPRVTSRIASSVCSAVASGRTDG